MGLSKTRKRKPLSMTSLIDVIFLLLLFFMLSSTFSRFAEVELQAASSSAQSSKPKLAFLRASDQGLSLNGTPVVLSELNDRVRDLNKDTPMVLLVNVNDGVTAQQLTDILVIVRDIPDLPISVMGAG